MRNPKDRIREIDNRLEQLPWLELSKDCFSKSHTRRIPADSDKAFDEIKFLNIVGM